MLIRSAQYQALLREIDLARSRENAAADKLIHAYDSQSWAEVWYVIGMLTGKIVQVACPPRTERGTGEEADYFNG